MNPIVEKPDTRPKKLVVEPTTRCNFKCEMCVKQSTGCQITEGDLGRETLVACSSLFKDVSTIIFTGIGEPLIHPDLEQYIHIAEQQMKVGGVIGFQTNGKLLSRERAVSLLRSGLNTICISVDTVQPKVFEAIRNGGTFSDIVKALDALAFAKNQLPSAKLKIGVEFVLMKKNIKELPLLVTWAKDQDIDFILVTHLTPYSKESEDQITWLANSHKAKILFDQYIKKAESKGLDLMVYTPGMWKFHQSEKEKQLCALAAELKDEAQEEGLYVNLFNLQAEPENGYEKIRSEFDTAVTLADQYNIELILPRIRPRTNRYCPFIEQDIMFVTWDGKVAPCYFLWHQYIAQRSEDAKKVTPVYFGNVNNTMPDLIWNHPDYKNFRQKVLKYDYPDCQAWCEKRCDYVLEPFFQDCYINDIPCCDCQWGLGFHNCLI